MTTFNFKAATTEKVLFVFGVRADTITKAEIVENCMKIKAQISTAKNINDGLDSANIASDIAEYEKQLKTLVELLDSGNYKKD